MLLELASLAAEFVGICVGTLRAASRQIGPATARQVSVLSPVFTNFAFASSPSMQIVILRFDRADSEYMPVGRHSHAV